METAIVVSGDEFVLRVTLTKRDAEQIASVLAYEYVSAEKPILKELVSNIVNFASK